MERLGTITQTNDYPTDVGLNILQWVALEAVTSEQRPTVLTPWDQAAARLSLKNQQTKHPDLRAAVEATVQRFPQLEERKLRDYLFKVAGITAPKATQLALPF